MGQHPVHGGVEILLVASYYRNQDKLQPLGSYAEFIVHFIFFSFTDSSSYITFFMISKV